MFNLMNLKITGIKNFFFDIALQHDKCLITKGFIRADLQDAMENILILPLISYILVDDLNLFQFHFVHSVL